MNDSDLIRQFEDCSFPFEQWHHKAHVRVAFLYLRDHSLEDAVARMRDGIQAYNTAHDVPKGPGQGYDETTTCALMQLIHVTMDAYGEMLPVASSQEFCDSHPQLMTKHVLRLFYSPQRRLDPDAKTTFLSPDLAPLPSVDKSN